MKKRKLYSLTTVLSLILLSSMAQASVEGIWSSKGVLNVTFSKANHAPVSTVSNLDESWAFNADKTFTRGTLTGTWKQKRGNPSFFEASYNRSSYATHLTNFWADRGIIASNIRILESKLLLKEVSNGLSGEEFLKYKMNVTENGGVRTVTVVIRGSFVALNGASDNAALSEFFPTMLQGQSSSASSSSVFMSTVTPIIFEGINTLSPKDNFFILEPTPIEPQ